ncbi:acyltransferase family protein [Allosphingosinicella deserti]|uniref:Acyltransferase n=1 Tax=Allosphingosinicella deserti TaxID=2116704 RepID=A0A2P7QJ57_9SPHN|nr:acyltransferase [Sphingomonas deserti]PSJ38005.1 acyltransferase [Sphingomonas deserti]
MEATSINSVDTQRPRLNGLQYLRAIAALQVVVHHAVQAAGIKLSMPGFGVPLFFVISGFLMVAITDAGSRPSPFFKDRLIRIVPLYWIATTVFLALLLTKTSVAPATAAASYLFLPFGAPGEGRHFFPLLNVGWTLNYEMMFYAIFALLLLLPRKALLPALTLVFVALAVASFFIPQDRAPFAFWCNPLILQFLAGAWLGHFWSLRASLGIPIIACFLAFFVLYSTDGVLRNTLWLGIQSTLLVIGTLELERAGAFARPIRPLRFLGDASYSIYLWHVFAIIVAVVCGRGIAAPAWSVATVGILGGVAAGLTSYWLLERPLLHIFRRKRHRDAIPIPAGP